MSLRRIALAALGLLFACSSWAAELSDVFSRVHGSVVVIRTTQSQLAPEGPRELVNVGGIGSGVVISADGKILTAAHVIQAADDLVVEFSDGTTIPATISSSEPAADLALIQLRRLPSKLTVAEIGDSDAVRVGDPCFVIGAPLGVSHTLTAGHVSARRQPKKTLGALWMAELLQTDAAVNPGNSGGPMFNMKGEIIGIVSHILSPDASFVGLGFAVTSNLARKLMLEEPSHWSGMEGVPVSGELAAALNVPGTGTGLLVQRVALLSPAQKLGLRAGRIRAKIEGQDLILGGDIILEAMGVACTGEAAHAEIRKRVAALSAGDAISVVVLRDGELVELKSRSEN